MINVKNDETLLNSILKIVALTLVFVVLVSYTTKKELPEVDIVNDTIELTVYDDTVTEPVDTLMTDSILVDMLRKYNVKFAYIVLAQARQESNHYKSKIAIENKNLFGLKVATGRPTTALGTKRNHAYYESYEMSVLDYALYQAAYMRKIKNERDYVAYLNRNYAADPQYDINIKRHFKETKAALQL